jgi:hypothetical protein
MSHDVLLGTNCKKKRHRGFGNSFFAMIRDTKLSGHYQRRSGMMSKRTLFGFAPCTR